MIVGSIAHAGRAARVLLVEDDEGDVLFTKKAFEKLATPVQLSVLARGDDVLPYLHKKAPYEQAQTPDIILMDINIPKKNGIELLEMIKQDSVLHSIPVIMLTSSAAMTDIQRSYAAYANAYVVKPVDYASFGTVMQAIEDFWFKANVASER
jgi:CheY-like chemotaxis protein